MKGKPGFSESRQIRRYRRSTRCMILEMHANTMAYRAFLEDYRQWTTTDSYRQEVARLQQTLAGIREQSGEDMERDKIPG